MLYGEPGPACDIVGREPPRGCRVRWRGDSLHRRQHARHERALRDGRAGEEPERLVALEAQGPLRMHSELVEGRDHTVLALTRSFIEPAAPRRGGRSLDVLGVVDHGSRVRSDLKPVGSRELPQRRGRRPAPRHDPHAPPPIPPRARQNARRRRDGAGDLVGDQVTAGGGAPANLTRRQVRHASRSTACGSDSPPSSPEGDTRRGAAPAAPRSGGVRGRAPSDGVWGGAPALAARMTEVAACVITSDRSNGATTEFYEGGAVVSCSCSCSCS